MGRSEVPGQLVKGPTFQIIEAICFPGGGTNDISLSYSKPLYEGRFRSVNEHWASMPKLWRSTGWVVFLLAILFATNLFDIHNSLLHKQLDLEARSELNRRIRLNSSRFLIGVIRFQDSDKTTPNKKQ